MYGHKACEQSELSIKSDANQGHGSISGYAAVFNNWDMVNEMFVPGAFAAGLDDFRRKGFVTIEHNLKSLPIATIADAREDDKGLWIEADFHSTSVAQEARTITAERLQRGKEASFSLGFLFLPSDTERTGRGRMLKKAKSIEASIANVPINEMAAVYGVKSLDLQAGLTMDDHQDEVQAALSGFVTRAQGLVELREKSGRKIAQARRERIRAAIEAFLSGAKDLEELLKETEHEAGEEADPETMKKSITAYLIEDARRKEMLRHGPLARTN